MRFTEDGPVVPDELLWARDEGRVVFFCGAGVSMARAGLVDFFGLAEQVIVDLGAAEDCDAAKVLNKAWEIGKEMDVTGLISADRVFSLLERDFSREDIQSAVARSLKPCHDVDQSAHEILLRLSSTPNGTTQLVTTNFDRLFEVEGKHIQLFQPPKLPQPSRFKDLDGIVYLHGRATEDYSHPEGNGFILSSSDFGQAYLSEGWANEFFREIIDEYIVVFIGYSADDPPIHYLLEGIGRSNRSANPIYAFQSQESNELVTRWRHKGVEAIPYSPKESHNALWTTLEEWAHRADDPDAWQKSVLTTALDGPQKLKPHLRGQVAHLVSTKDGARAFNEINPPAEWLCVFDPRCRLGRTLRIDGAYSVSDEENPFWLFGLDFDNPPNHEANRSLEQVNQEQEVAWDAFKLNDYDKKNLAEENLPKFRDHFQTVASPLPKRIFYLAGWLANNFKDPSTIWWAARQSTVNPQVSQMIEWRLTQHDEDADNEVRRAWSYILEWWNVIPNNREYDWHELRSDIERHGWSAIRLRKFLDLNKPYLKVRPSYRSGPIPPESSSTTLREFVDVEIHCNSVPRKLEFPKEWLIETVRGLRRNLEHAAELSVEIGDHRFTYLCPIEKDESPDISPFQRDRGLSGFVVGFAGLFLELLHNEHEKAKEEYRSWPMNEDVIFARLRLWAAGKRKLATVAEFARVIQGLSDGVFWGSYHQRDLLAVLAARWSELTPKQQKKIEQRLLAGPPKYEYQQDDEHREHRAWQILNRLEWLEQQGCSYVLETMEDDVANLKLDCPKWKRSFAKHAADSRESRGGFVRTDTSHHELLEEPIRNILAKASGLFGRNGGSQLVENDPFLGLCTNRRKRAYLALAFAAKRGDYPNWAWKTFLRHDLVKKDATAFSAIIGVRLLRVPTDCLGQFIHEASWWLKESSESLSQEFPDLLDRLFGHFIGVLTANPNLGKSAILSASGWRDRIGEAINSPVGHVVQAALSDSRIELEDKRDDFLNLISACLNLEGDGRRHAICLATQQLSWLYAVAQTWTEKNLLVVVEGDGTEIEKESFWAGLLWHGKISPKLFVRLKQFILKFATATGLSEESVKSVARLLIQWWLWKSEDTSERYISDTELRDSLVGGAEALRTHALWHFERGLSADEEDQRNDWLENAQHFFRNVWPKHRATKSSRVTAVLVETLTADQKGFAVLFDIVMPHLTKMVDAKNLHFHYRDVANQLVKANPLKITRLLYKVLPDSTDNWPWGIGDVFDSVLDSDSAIGDSPEFQRLKRQWDSR